MYFRPKINISNGCQDNNNQHISNDVFVGVETGVTESKINLLFVAQERCIRILFGDKEANLQNHRTAARTRHHDLQKLGPDFFKREHIKPF